MGCAQDLHIEGKHVFDGRTIPLDGHGVGFLQLNEEFTCILG